ncbi:MAG: iron ABC transporter permease [Dehalococcoidia bacterium]|nr:iron ABC transporter permease [Dehalococcoidia bacterium]MYI86130.1 iron ABC transporter permease [Dehalococcoidia bacterium]
MSAAPGVGAVPGWARLVAAGVILVALAALAVAHLSVGEPIVAPADLPGILMGDSGDRIEQLVVRELRVPRLLLALLAGAGFGLSGAILQVVLRNPLASPELLGVSAGASLAMAAILLLNAPVLFALHPLVALAGGLGGGLIVLATSRGARTPLEAALIGVAVAALLNGAILAIISLAASSGAVRIFFLFTVGNLANRTWDHVELVWPWVIAGIPAAFLLARGANVLQLHEDVASSLGMPARRMRLVFVALAAVLIGSLVAVAGPIAWVGLLTPHVARLIVPRPDARLLFPVATVVGAFLVLASDVLSKVLLYPREIPVGLCATLLAAPMILLLLRRTNLGLNRQT